jgi:8-amino-7-oxononanoate synthase
MNPFDHELSDRLTAIRDAGLLRELRRVESPQGPRLRLQGRWLLNFSSNDYLGLANHPALKEAAARALADFGAGAGASRLICGSLAPHHELEEALAAFKGTEAALTFSSGYATALGVIPALMGKNDVILLDRLVHACLVDAARLSGAKLRVFAHNDLDDLEAKLRWATQGRSAKRNAHGASTSPQVLVLTESVFSMDGDTAPLRALVDLKERHGAWLMVDEAHATGLYGPRRRGLAEVAGVADRIEIQMGTLGKALGAAGGYIAGSRVLIDYLVNRARSFLFSTAPLPAVAAAATAAVRLVQSAEGEERRHRLWQRVAQCRAGVPSGLLQGPWSSGEGRGAAPAGLASSAILPLRVGEEARAVQLATALRQRGFFIPAIRYPTVARGQARLRLTLTASHTTEEVAAVCDALPTAQSEISNRPSEIPAPRHAPARPA